MVAVDTDSTSDCRYHGCAAILPYIESTGSSVTNRFLPEFGEVNRRTGTSGPSGMCFVCSLCGHETHISQDRLSQFMVIIREWRHIKMAKRAGRGHHRLGIAGTSQGELSIPCRACPHPGINLPADWAQAPPEKRYVRKCMRGSMGTDSSQLVVWYHNR